MKLVYLLYNNTIFYTLPISYLMFGNLCLDFDWIVTDRLISTQVVNGLL